MNRSGQALRGELALVTGAASGLGLALARQAARAGMRLLLADIDATALARAAAALRDGGTDVAQRAVDVSDAGQVAALAESCLAQHGVPRLLFNNAGVIGGGLIWETPASGWDRVMGINLGGVAAGVRAFVPAMIAEGRRRPGWRARVVNTASMAGLLAPPNMGVYAVSKHAVVAFTEILHHDLRLVDAPVDASVLCPFFVPTGIADGHPGGTSASARVAQAMTARAVAGGRVDADTVAQRVFDGIAENRFYLFSHPHALGGIGDRAAAILDGRAPADPFAGRPDLEQALRDALRAAGATDAGPSARE